MNLQLVEQLEKDSILNVLQYAVGPNEISLKKAVYYFIKIIKGLCTNMKKKLV